MSSDSKSSDALLALLSASMALPGLAAKANEQGYRSDKASLSFYSADYRESDARMDAGVKHISLRMPILERAELTFDAIRDSTSGASPVINMLDSRGRPQQILEAGASIIDERNVLEAEATYYADKAVSAAKVGYSKEDDYRSRYISANTRLSFNEKNTTLSLGMGYSKDDVSNTYEPGVILNTPTQTHQRKKIDFLLGVQHVLDKNSVASLNLVSSYSSGYLSDPYKKVFVKDQALVFVPTDVLSLFSSSDFAQQTWVGGLLNEFLQSNGVTDLDGVLDFLNASGVSLAFNTALSQIDLLELDDLLAVAGIQFDARPRERKQHALSASYSRYITQADAGLHIDYRFGFDSWGAHSHTLDTKWSQSLGAGWVVSPALRYYSQAHADFYNVYFDQMPENNFVSADYRLASFAALAKKLEVRKQVTEALSVQLNYEHYDRRFDWAINKGRGDELDDYTTNTFSFHVKYEF